MGRVVHFEIHADQPERAAEFYTQLFGWQISKVDIMEYWMIVTGPEGTPGINGGMLKRPHPLTGNDGVIAYVCTATVDNVDQSVAKALQLGGAIALPKMPVPTVGWLAYVKDTEGNVFGMLQPDPTAA